MKQILVMMAAVVLVGCGEFKEGFKKGFDRQKKAAEARVAAEKKAAEAAKTPQQTKATPEKLIADPIVEKAVRKELFKPKGELTEADLVKVTALNLSDTKITDAGLKEVAKLQKLTYLNLFNTKTTDAGVAELKKALPKCNIDGP
jgi:hypothetical protein